MSGNMGTIDLTICNYSNKEVPTLFPSAFPLFPLEGAHIHASDK
jgi:hypothetical protein